MLFKPGTDTLAAEQGLALVARFNVPHHVYADRASEKVLNWWPYFRASCQSHIDVLHTRKQRVAHCCDQDVRGKVALLDRFRNLVTLLMILDLLLLVKIHLTY